MTPRVKSPTQKIAIIVIWMGPLPSYFPLWVRSLRKNDSFDFFLFTDQVVETDKPGNLKTVCLSFQQMRDLIAEKLSLKTNIPYPYKLCDFRPAYGEIFNDYLAPYDFWGVCDIDVLFGDLKKFITDELLTTYKKILSRGHLSLYRNEPVINAAYRSSGSVDHKKILESEQCFIFDEWNGIYRILKEMGIAQYNEEIMADIKVYSTRLICTNIRNFKPQIFVWEEGDVKQYYIEEGKLKTVELAYVHFQKRKIFIPDPNVYTSRAIILGPRALLRFEGPITTGTVKKYDRPDYNHYVGSQWKRIKKRLFSFKKGAVSLNKTLPKA